MTRHSSSPPCDDEPVLAVRDLSIHLPDGRRLIDGLTLAVRPRETVVILGGSGSGKSTFLGVLVDRAGLEKEGFSVRATRLSLRHEELGLVPQRGALFDYLDVRGNLELAIRFSAGAQTDSTTPEEWVERLDLPRRLVTEKVPVARLSGGQAQRIAVARALAGGRRLLCLDEPTSGLDPLRVRNLARLIRFQCDALNVAALVVTHDVAFAAGAADRLFVLSADTATLEPLLDTEWPGPTEREGIGEGERERWRNRLERALSAKLEADGAGPDRASAPPPRARSVFATGLGAVGAFAVSLGLLATAVRTVLGWRFWPPREVRPVMARILRQALLRPLLFYFIVSTLLGYTVLYVISEIGGAGVRPDAMVREIGGSYIVALAPAFSAILFVAASGGATNAWLGNMVLTQQVAAMRALGVPTGGYLFIPVWLVLMGGYLVVAAVFAAGMIAGGTALTVAMGMESGFELLTGDLLDPVPYRVRYRLRAAVLVWVYGWGIASDVVARSARNKRTADDVTRAMTGSVVACTFWMVIWELITVLAVFRV